MVVGNFEADSNREPAFEEALKRPIEKVDHLPGFDYRPSGVTEPSRRRHRRLNAQLRLGQLLAELLILTSYAMEQVVHGDSRTVGRGEVSGSQQDVPDV